MSTEGLKEVVCAAVDARMPALAELSARIHAHPELGFEERRAAHWLTEFLAAQGLEVERGIASLPTAFAARAGTGRPRVALICEYDALPEIGHGCGHNIIAAAGAGAGAVVASVLSETGGSVVVLGTPAEEGGGGKILMARAGAFDDVDAAMMVHPAGRDLPGIHALAVCQLEVEYHGRAAHAAAAPERGVNALDALVTGYVALAQLRQHIRADERLHGIITRGGDAPNVVPEHTSGLFLVRAGDQRRLARLRKRVEECFRAGSVATGADLSITQRGEEYSEVVTNVPLLAAYAGNLARFGRSLPALADLPSGVTGSTDMGNISKLVPSIHPMIALSSPEVPLHSAEFARRAGSLDGEKAILLGAKVMASTVVDFLVEPALRAACTAAFCADVVEATPDRAER